MSFKARYNGHLAVVIIIIVLLIAFWWSIGAVIVNAL